MTKLTVTFDNGPTPGVTEKVLDALRSRDLKSTFFLVGDKLATAGASDLASQRARRGSLDRQSHHAPWSSAR